MCYDHCNIKNVPANLQSFLGLILFLSRSISIYLLVFATFCFGCHYFGIFFSESVFGLSSVCSIWLTLFCNYCLYNPMYGVFAIVASSPIFISFVLITYLNFANFPHFMVNVILNIFLYHSRVSALHDSNEICFPAFL